MTYLARHVHVGKEVHLDLDDPVPLARLTPAASYVEAEPPRLIAAHLRLGELREQLAHVREHPGVGRRVRPRGPPDRRLVHVDRLVEMLESLHRVVRPGPVLGPKEVLSDLAAEDVGDERGFARATHARNGDEGGERERDVEVLQIVGARAANHQALAVAFPAASRDRYLAVSSQ